MQSLSVLILSSLNLAAAWQQSSTCILGGDACPTGSSCTPTQTCGYVSLSDFVSVLVLLFEPQDRLLVAGHPLFTSFNKIYRITCLQVQDSILTLNDKQWPVLHPNHPTARYSLHRRQQWPLSHELNLHAYHDLSDERPLWWAYVPFSFNLPRNLE